MKIAISGSHGLIGMALVTALEANGYEIFRLVRGPSSGPKEISWDPGKKTLDIAKFAQINAVINLAGAGIGEKRWSEQRKQSLIDSRVKSTQTLVEAFSTLPNPPSVLISASAIGYYGNRGDEILEEFSSRGTGFLAELCESWEAAANIASALGVRVVLLRTAMVLSTQGGALSRQLPIFKSGIGGKMGSGKQWTSWISLPDVISAIQFLLESPSSSGPVNLSSPEPVINSQYSYLLGQALQRPALLTTPKLALTLLFGAEAVEEFILSSQRVVPKKLIEMGFKFDYSDLKTAFSNLFKNQI